MNTDDYRAAYEGRVGSDRMSLRLAIIPDPLRGDMDEVIRLNAKILDLEKQLADWVDWKEDRP